MYLCYRGRRPCWAFRIVKAEACRAREWLYGLEEAEWDGKDRKGNLLNKRGDQDPIQCSSEFREGTISTILQASSLACRSDQCFKSNMATEKK